MIKKEQFVKLAQACLNQDNYEHELRDKIESIAEKYKQDTDFLGLPMLCDELISAVIDVLGEDFSYLLYDCQGDFDEFNKNTTNNDGSHPDIHSLEELYDYVVLEGSV